MRPGGIPHLAGSVKTIARRASTAPRIGGNRLSGVGAFSACERRVDLSFGVLLGNVGEAFPALRTGAAFIKKRLRASVLLAKVGSIAVLRRFLPITRVLKSMV